MNYSPQLEQQQQQQQPPAWALQPATAWIYLVVAIALALSPVYYFGFILAIVAAVFTYQDRKAHGYPAFWWTLAVVIFGALAYLFYVYKRPRGAAAVQSPQAVAAAPSTPADWYPDPRGEARLRYWDGANWTDHISS